MTRIVDFLPQYESEIQFLRDRKPTDYSVLLCVLYGWAKHVERLSDEEVIKGNTENEKFVERFFEETSKVADFSLLDRRTISNPDLLVLIDGYKRARGLQQKV